MSVLALAALVGVLLLQLGGSGFLSWAIAFLVLAVIAGLMGFGGVAGLSMDIAKWLVVIFLVLAVVAFVL